MYLFRHFYQWLAWRGTVDIRWQFREHPPPPSSRREAKIQVSSCNWFWPLRPRRVYSCPGSGRHEDWRWVVLNGISQSNLPSVSKIEFDKTIKWSAGTGNGHVVGTDESFGPIPWDDLGWNTSASAADLYFLIAFFAGMRPNRRYRSSSIRSQTIIWFTIMQKCFQIRLDISRILKLGQRI